MRPTVLLDVDDVLTDCARAMVKFHNGNLPFDDYRWELAAQLGMTPGAFWEPLGYDFWRTLPWHPQGRELLSRVVARVGWDRVALCTSPCKTPGCAEGKIGWIEENIPQLARRFVITPVKGDACAAPGRILVDDRESNVDEYRECGGPAVLVPQPWNRRWKYAGGDYDPKAVVYELEAYL